MKKEQINYLKEVMTEELNECNIFENSFDIKVESIELDNVNIYLCTYFKQTMKTNMCLSCQAMFYKDTINPIVLEIEVLDKPTYTIEQTKTKMLITLKNKSK